jgi:hypothetical protein
MNEYLKMARRYFDAFEGRQLYPSLKTWHWWGWCTSLLALIACLRLGATQGTNAQGNLPTLTMYLAEALFVAMSLSIDSYKKHAVLAAAEALHGKSFCTVDDCRREALERICGVPSDKFVAVAKECADLIALQKTHGLSADRGAQY